MPNAKNYKENISTLTPGQKIERVVIDEEYVIKQNKSGKDEFYYGLDLTREFVELHFYVPNTDTLVYTAIVPLDSPHFLFVTEQNDTDNIANLELDFWTEGPPEGEIQNQFGQKIRYSNADSLQDTYLSGLPSGDYDVIINFFADELGTYDDINWRIKTISPSKTEIVLHANPGQNGSETVDFDARISRDYEQFLLPSLFLPKFGEALDEIVGVDDNADRVETINDIQLFLNQFQREKISLMESNLSISFNEYLQNILDHILYETRTFANDEISGELSGGARYRIQQNRLYRHLNSILTQIVGEHEISLNTNDSGPVPFIVNQ